MVRRLFVFTFPFTLRSRVLFNPGGMMGYGVNSYLGLDEIGSPSPMMIFTIISYLFIRTFWILSVRAFC